MAHPSDKSDSKSRFVQRLIRKVLPFRWLTKSAGDQDDTLRDTIEVLIEESDNIDSSIESDERMLLGNVLSLRDLTAQDVMRPRADMISIPIDADSSQVASIVTKSKRSRFPIYKDTLDDIVGVLDIKDFLAWTQSKKIFNMKQLVKEALFVSPSMRTLDLLFLMRETGSKIAFVVDEYGGVDGMIAFSDLIEEIIGDIQDAQSQIDPGKVEVRQDGSIIADARITLESLADDQGLDLREDKLAEDVDTIGGLVVSIAGRVPSSGELIRHTDAGIEIEVLDADPRRVKKICLRRVA